MRFTHIFWDFDGTLYDTYPVMASLLEKALATQGIQESADDIEGYMRVSMGHARKHYGEKYALEDGFLRLPLMGVLQEARAFPGIPELLREVLERGGRHYLYTHRGQSALDMLERGGLMAYFTDSATGEDGFPAKPDPTALRHLMQKHGLSPQDCLMVGDRQIDIDAGKNAGMGSFFFLGRPGEIEALRAALA